MKPLPWIKIPEKEGLKDAEHHRGKLSAPNRTRVSPLTLSGAKPPRSSQNHWDRNFLARGLFLCVIGMHLSALHCRFRALLGLGDGTKRSLLGALEIVKKPCSPE